MCRRSSAWNILSLILEKHAFFEELFDERHASRGRTGSGFTAHREASSPLVARSVTVETVPTRGTAPPRTGPSSRIPDMAADDWRSRPSPTCCAACCGPEGPRAVDCVEKCWAAASVLGGGLLYRRRHTAHPLPTNRKLILLKTQSNNHQQTNKTIDCATSTLLNVSESHTTISSAGTGPLHLTWHQACTGKPRQILCA